MLSLNTQTEEIYCLSKPEKTQDKKTVEKLFTSCGNNEDKKKLFTNLL